ncbi:MAG: PsiF family protein [Betaproteobacteria bacterium]
MMAPATPMKAPDAKAADAKAPNAQQERMKTCNADAKGKTGDERKKFMSACLSGEAPKMTQQDKMKSCNTKAGPMKGDERKKFMSSCLSA